MEEYIVPAIRHQTRERIAGGAFAGYAISRTVSLPGLPIEGEWLEPLGVLSPLVDVLFVGVYLAILAHPKEETREVEASPF